jgi:Transposase IS116/IS110/IS902 family
MSVPGIGPLISTAVIAAIGTGEAFERGRDFGAWLGLVPRQYRQVADPPRCASWKAARGGKQCADNLLRAKRSANEVRFILRSFDGANFAIVIDLVSAPKPTSRVSGSRRVFSPN